jgi:hypothetical protein
VRIGIRRPAGRISLRSRRLQLALYSTILVAWHQETKAIFSLYILSSAPQRSCRSNRSADEAAQCTRPRTTRSTSRWQQLRDLMYVTTQQSACSTCFAWPSWLLFVHGSLCVLSASSYVVFDHEQQLREGRYLACPCLLARSLDGWLNN